MATVIEELKRERANLRRTFTRKYNEIISLVENEESDVDDITAATEVLEVRVQAMFELDERIYQLLVQDKTDESEIDNEIEQADSYRMKWIVMKKKVEKKVYTIENLAIANHGNSTYGSIKGSYDKENQNNKQNRKYNLPKIELKKFDGNIKNWLSFWGQFRKIDEDKEIDDDDKYQYLLQSMELGTNVREIVESFPPSGKSYRHALEQLKSRFARDDLLIEVYVRELLGLILLQAKQGNRLSLTALYDQLSAHIRSLESLGVTKEKYSAFIYPMIESALPSDILKIWERNRPELLTADSSDKELNNLLLFLKREVDSEQRVNMARSTFLDKENRNPEPPTAECLVASIKRTDTKLCLFCEKTSHASVECYKLQKMTIEQRKEIIKKKKACSLCLKIGHFVKFCKAYSRCCICLKRHSVILCPGKLEETAASSSTSNNDTVSNNSTQVRSVTLLQTIIVTAMNGDKKIKVRALFDSGAQRSYIKKSIVENLGLKPVSKELLSHFLFSGIQTKTEEHDVFNISIQSLDKSFKFNNLCVLAQSRICGDLPSINLSDNNLLTLLKSSNVSLTDKGIDNPEIGLLIGADYAGFFMTNEILNLYDGLVAVKTKLGWTIIGKQAGLACNINTLICSTDISTFWSLETLGIRDPLWEKTVAEKDAQIFEDFKNNISINEQQRYEVQLPWKVDCQGLLSNYDLAKARLLSTTKRLHLCGKLDDYNKVFKEWHELNIIETISESDEDIYSGHYLSHHAIINENRLSTKIRPVFNASAKDKNQNSLNVYLEKGLNLIENIPKLLLRFRKGTIGIISDIEKAFLQISIIPKDRNYLKFLWWKDALARELVTYRHCRLVFGLSCSPFILSATLLLHLENVTGEYKNCANEMIKSFYVDNCITSVDSESEAIKFMTEAKEIMSWANFGLRQWAMSHNIVNETGKEDMSVLGIMWNMESDELYCNINLPEKGKLCKFTKRNILSLTQKIFDPIGFMCAVTLVPRIIIQELWMRKTGWDEEVPWDIHRKFLKWYENITYIKDCRIPRRITKDSLKDCQLSFHTFCDACKDGYAACVFLRAESNGTVSVQLLSAKSRVAPTQKMTIPRLELMAALIATRLATETKKWLELPVFDEYFWTDSNVVLCWIKKELSWNTFVANRVKEIRASSNSQNWYHIPGDQNWADIASRGCDAKQLFDLRWFEGPPWLQYNSEIWPRSGVNVNEDEAVRELKKRPCIISVCSTDNFLDQLSYFSTYTKIIRTLAWIMRFIHNAKHVNEKIEGELKYEEVEKAEKKIILLVQKGNRDFLEKRCTNLKVIIDTEGLMRIETKLTLGDFSEGTKKPFVVPAKHFIVTRMIEECHRRLQHAGNNIVIADIRKRFWVIGIRLATKSIISKCVVCRRFNAKRLETSMAPLPIDRINCSATFEVTGVDLAGPLYLRGGEKCWVVLYTCAVYRAVHLELVRSLSTEEFLMTFRRFVARRGRVKVMMSDNGTNFVGANNLFKQIDWNEVQRHSNIVRIKWKFNVPTAAWWGGYWERLIKILKDLLRKVLGRRAVKYDEMQTILCDCEATMNARPLTYVEDDKTSSLEPLTPMCFLHPLPSCDVEDCDQVDKNSLNRRLRYLQKLRDDFRQRFRTEYLTCLLQKGQHKIDEVKVGDIVIVETADKRLKWPLGLVTEIGKGRDGVDRVVKLKTTTGTKIRPMQKLYKLEVSAGTRDALRTRSGRESKPPTRLGIS